MNNTSTLKVFTYIFLFLHGSLSLDAQDACTFIKTVQNYQDSVKISFNGDSYVIDTLTFQLDSYLSKFEKLKKSPDRRFEIFYEFAILNGEPIIYTVPKDFEVELYIKDIIKKSPGPKYRISNDLKPEEMRDLIFYDFVNDSARRAFHYLIPEDTKQGYLQYLLFYIVGEQFALFGHSFDFEKRILCTKDDKAYIYKRYDNNTLLYVDKEDLKKIDNVNITPIIKSTESHYYITWYELETHRGLFKREYEINRTRPNKIREVSATKLIDIKRTFNY